MPEYGVWVSMKQRCSNKNTSNYHRYGGRGISVCDRWVESFDNFIADMGERPTGDHSIDRIDNDGDYNPDNCKWSTRLEQGRNTRRNRILDFNGEVCCVSEVANQLGVDSGYVTYRLNNGMEIKKPVIKKEIKVLDIESIPTIKITEMIKKLGGTQAAMAKQAGISPQSLNNMIRQGKEVLQLANGDYIATSKHTVIFKGVDNE